MRTDYSSCDENAHRKGVVIWITGLSGSGKSTIGREVLALLRDFQWPTVLLDGDDLRSIIAEDLGFSRADRLRSGFRNARLCRYLALQGINVICPTISLFSAIRTWNRKNIDLYLEVYVRVPLDVLIDRDARGLYSRAQAGLVQNVVGLDEAWEEPTEPHMIVDNQSSPFMVPQIARSIAEEADRLIAANKPFTS